MTRDVPPEFQAHLDQFNARQGGPSVIALAWSPKVARWRVYAVPVSDSSHPLARNGITKQLLRPFCDGSGRLGVPLFWWDDPLDRRLFDVLYFADSFRDKRHFEQTIEQSEAAREQAKKARRLNALGAAREYWQAIDRTLVPVNPAMKSTGDWRAHSWWR